ncbi:MAG: hypothetical protein ACXWQO_10755 [Bdellovibrionota bacterium]
MFLPKAGIFLLYLLFTGLAAAAGSATPAVPLEERTAKMEKFPCSSCHTGFPRKTAQNLRLPLQKEHRNLVFQHMNDPKKCALCHAEKEPNKLVLLDGATISMNESPQLCGQCHGPIYLDWKEGIHGKRFGKGTAKNVKFLCVACHDPHSPKFKKMKSDPPPHKPKFGVEKKE